MLGLAVINGHTKFEVSTFSHYEDMKGNAKYRNWGMGGLGVQGYPSSVAMLETICVYRVIASCQKYQILTHNTCI